MTGSTERLIPRSPPLPRRAPPPSVRRETSRAARVRFRPTNFEISLLAATAAVDTGGTALSERVTAATDYLLAAAALAGAFLLWRRADPERGLPVRLWAGAFAAIGAAAILGGTWHGFSPRLLPIAARVLWKATLAATGAAGFFLVTGAAYGSVGRRVARWITAAAAVKLALFLVWASLHDEYDGVVVDSTATMAAVAALQIHARRSRRAASAPWILAGIAVSLAAATIEAVRWSPSRWFTHDDLYHVVQIGALALLYRGGRLLSPVAN